MGVESRQDLVTPELAGIRPSWQASVWAAGEPETTPEWSLMADQVLTLVNRARGEGRMPPLRANPILMRMAQAHAIRMARLDRGEDWLDGAGHEVRLAAAGYKITDRLSQANIVSAHVGLMIPEVAVRAWLDDNASRANILGKYTETGIGIAISNSKTAYYYQVFAVPEE
jgi:uncharacterized protein YkwD